MTPPAHSTAPAARVRLALIDGYALVYRAFYAMITRPLQTRAGENTSIPWGVANLMTRLTAGDEYDALAWVFDAGDSGRTALHPAYKATREALPPELLAQFEQGVRRTEELLAAWRVPVVRVPGYEADDVIGTLATRARAAGWHTTIVTGDKDMVQLVDDAIEVLRPATGGPGGHQETRYTAATAHERLGVPAHHVVDFLALCGDASDNIPGVKGIGEKTAIDLLRTFGSLDAMLARAAEIPAKRPREALLAQSDAARLSQRLVRLQTDVPVPPDLATFRRVPPDLEALGRVLAALEFRGLFKRLGIADGSGDAPAAAAAGPGAPATRASRAGPPPDQLALF